MPSTLDDEIKQAKRDKFLAEIEKTNAERNKVLHETEEAIKESKRPWWWTTKVRQNIIPGIIGLGFLGFYISYAVVPAFQVENMHLKLDNERVAKILFDREQRLVSDSLELRVKIRFIDSLSNTLIFKERELAIIKYKMDSTFPSVISKLKNSDVINQNTAKQILDLYKKIETDNQKPSWLNSNGYVQIGANNPFQSSLLNDNNNSLLYKNNYGMIKVGTMDSEWYKLLHGTNNEVNPNNIFHYTPVRYDSQYLLHWPAPIK